MSFFHVENQISSLPDLLPNSTLRVVGTIGSMMAVCYAKLIVLKSDGKVIGLHYLGPNAGEVTQGFAGMIAMGACKSDFDSLIGIHPTTAEVFVGMDITKSSGVDPAAAGC